ncbi:hypothetical protein [Piscinibacter sakaiensis]|uniref:hypothetical protein n=1 Tax=Piscinibacter sakaiensis TaxID=1547922 RepID=UPI003AAF096F
MSQTIATIVATPIAAEIPAEPKCKLQQLDDIPHQVLAYGKEFAKIEDPVKTFTFGPDDARITYSSDVYVECSDSAERDKIEIGFIQTVVSQTKCTVYSNGDIWQETLASIPCLDGSQQADEFTEGFIPFFKKPVTLTRNGADGRQTITATDLPSFTYPRELTQDGQVIATPSVATLEVDFIVALAARYRGMFESTFYYLATFDWRLHGRAGDNGVSGTYVADPCTRCDYARDKPATLKISGESANFSARYALITP